MCLISKTACIAKVSFRIAYSKSAEKADFMAKKKRKTLAKTQIVSLSQKRLPKAKFNGWGEYLKARFDSACVTELVKALVLVLCIVLAVRFSLANTDFQMTFR